MRRVCLLFCVLCSFLRLFSSDKKNLPQKDAFSKIQSIENCKQDLLLLQADLNSSFAEKNSLKDKIHLSLSELESDSFIADSNDPDFDFSLSESGDSFTFAFFLGEKIVYSGKGSVPSVQGKMCDRAEFIYSITADKEKESVYYLTPRAIKLLNEDGKIIYQKEIKGRLVSYHYIPATFFSWNDEKTVIKSSGISLPKEKTFFRGMDVMLPYTIFAENGEFHSIGFDFTLDFHFRPYVFLGGTIGFSADDSSVVRFLLEVLSGITSNAESSKNNKEKSESGKTYGTATIRAGAYFPLTPSFESYLPAMTVQTFVEGGFVNSRPAYGYGITAAIHGNPHKHAGGAAGLFASYSHFNTSGKESIHKGSFGLYVKLDNYYK